MSWLLRTTTALLLMWAVVGCAETANPPGTGASGEPLDVVPEDQSQVPEEIANPRPGSGLGVGPGDGTGRMKYPDQGGQSEHERGTGGQNRKKKAEAGETTIPPAAEKADDTEKPADAEKPADSEKPAEEPAKPAEEAKPE